MKALANQIRSRSARLALSQAEVARRSGVTERAFNHYMSERSEPNISTLMRIADVLGCTPNDLLGVTVDPPEKLDARGRLGAQIAATCRALDEQSLGLAASLLNAMVEHVRSRQRK